MIGTLRQRHDLPMVTPAAILRCVGGIDFHELPASLFRFARQFAEKFRPRCIMNALGKTMIMGHAVDMQIFHRYDTKSVNDLTGFLMGEIIAPEGNPLVNTRYHLAVFLAFRTNQSLFGVFALHTSQGLFFLAEKAGVLNLFTSGKSRKGFQANVDSYLSRYIGQMLRFALNRERHVPFARTTTPDG